MRVSQGLGAAMPAQERTDLLNFTHKHKSKDFSDSSSVAPDQVNAHDIMCKQIVKITNRLIASKYFLKELEQLALDWLEDQFTGRAADQWHIIVREASRTATTSGIGPNNVLYRQLCDMLLAYPVHCIKSTIMRSKATDPLYRDGVLLGLRQVGGADPGHGRCGGGIGRLLLSTTASLSFFQNAFIKPKEQPSRMLLQSRTGIILV
jgi:hypothetical protein